MHMNWIESQYQFPQIDPSIDTYLEDYPDSGELIYEYGFQTVAQMKKLLSERAGGLFSEKEISEIAKTTFRNKPKTVSKTIENDDRQIADFIYQF